jgi:membrane protease YdiL (CAAX protease family)
MPGIQKGQPIVLDEASAATRSVLRISLHWPIMTSLVLLVIALFFKWVDTFVLRLDERLGEIILCKTLGFVMVMVFVWAAGRSLRDIGLHSRRLGTSLLIGAGVAAIALVVAYAAEFALQLDGQPAFRIAAIDTKGGLQGGLLFALWLILGNVINAFMEEGLFRGVMVRLFRVKLPPWPANALQAFLFGLWHLPWVLKWHQTGQIEAHGGIFLAALGQFLPMFLVGVAWGYFYIKTDSLWVPWSAHFLNNTVLNLVHLTTSAGVESGASIRGPVLLVVTLLGMVLAKYAADRFGMPEVKPWGHWAPDDRAAEA